MILLNRVEIPTHKINQLICIVKLVFHMILKIFYTRNQIRIRFVRANYLNTYPKAKYEFYPLIIMK